MPRGPSKYRAVYLDGTRVGHSAQTRGATTILMKALKELLAIQSTTGEILCRMKTTHSGYVLDSHTLQNTAPYYVPEKKPAQPKKLLIERIIRENSTNLPPPPSIAGNRPRNKPQTRPDPLLAALKGKRLDRTKTNHKFLPPVFQPDNGLQLKYKEAEKTAFDIAREIGLGNPTPEPKPLPQDSRECSEVEGVMVNGSGASKTHAEIPENTAVISPRTNLEILDVSVAAKKRHARAANWNRYGSEWEEKGDEPTEDMAERTGVDGNFAARPIYDPKRDGIRHHTTLTGHYAGDPVPGTGRSALEQKQKQG